MTTADFERELRAMQERYRAGCADRVAEIRQLAARWLEERDTAAAQRLIRALHRLAGSAGTFGFDIISEHATQAESEARRLAGTLGAGGGSRLRSVVDELTEAVRRELKNPEPPAPEPGGSKAATKRRRDGRPIVYFPGGAAEARFGLALREAGFRTDTALRSEDRGRVVAVVGTQPDLLQDPGPEQALRVALLPSESFEDRLAAARARAQTVLVEPVDEEALVQILEELRGDHIERPPRLVVVDDDPDVAKELARILELEGMEVRWVTRASEVLSVVREHRPDVLLTDLRMPHCDGFELAAIVRQDPSLISLPVVFMSADESYVERASVQHDGDAFVRKGEALPTFVRLIRSKARRARRLEASLTTDGMTGLLRHVVFKERLDNEVARARRQGEVLSCVMLDIDRFKQINDVHGHATGDRVIQGLARLVRRRLRATDLVGRYGGEEFALALVQTPGDRALALVDDLRRRFGRLVFSSPKGSIQATFSAGVSTYPECDSRDELLVAADEALYAAKQGGRDRVVAYRGLSTRARSA